MSLNKKSPWLWVPVLNFVSGLPYAIVISVSVLMYKNLGISNKDIGVYTSLLYLPWVIKPLWSPFIDLYGTKRNWFLAMQLLISITFLLVGLFIPAKSFFMITLALFWMAAFASASNDVASDGYFLLTLTDNEQSLFLGIRSTFYKLAQLTGNGLIIMFAGYMEERFSDPTRAWSYTMIGVGLFMAILTIYNLFFTPKTEAKQEQTTNSPSFGEVFVSFFQKKQIGIILTFILVFRLGESQLIKMLVPFLVDAKEIGGMGVSTEAVGVIYGTFGVVSLLIGGILGGITISKFGLKKVFLPMILAMHLPIIGFILLAFLHPQNDIWIYITVMIEQFGYGFGFAAFMMYLIHVAEGPSKTSHYALATGFMAMGMMLPGMISGYIQEYLGYDYFFVWVFLATLPGVFLSFYLEYPSDFGKEKTEESH